MLKKTLLLIGLIFTQTSYLRSQIYINEMLASNASVNADPQYDANADWIELYNAGSSTVDLNGYYITDSRGTPTKYRIPQSILIQPKGFLLIWADGKATGLHTNFKLSASGEFIGLYDAARNLVDSTNFDVQNSDISYGRKPDGSVSWVFFAVPTPGSSNLSTAFSGKVLNFPRFVQPGGLYQSSLIVEMLNDLGGVMRYTLDGSDPTSASPVYTAAIPVTQTTIIRARVFKDNEIPGPIVTHSYFINQGSTGQKLPVVSISTNPENFWDSQKGIYVQNFKPEWEIPVNIELFENDGSNQSAFNLQAGIKVNGLYSWQLPQKMLGIYFKKQYGESKLAYQLFYDRNRKSFKDFSLRASGNDWGNTLFRDGLVQQACHNFNMSLDNMGFRPCVVYVNGEYMGIHNMCEKVDIDYIVSNHGVDKDSVDIIENENLAEAGNFTNYNAFKTLYSKDLSLQANFDAVAKVMDIENFTDLIVTEMYSANNSIDHNVMAWKPTNEGKWKWVLMDLDRGFYNAGSSLISFYIGQDVWPFSQLMTNAAYKTYFGTRLVNHLYTTYNPIRIKNRIDWHKNLIEAEIPNHIERWKGTTSLNNYGVKPIASVTYWNNEVAKLKTFADARPPVLLTDLQKYGFSAPAQLSLNVSPSVGGEIQFNGMKVPESSWTGSYPMNLPIVLKAVDRPGYTFKGWAKSSNQTILAKESTWKYLDNGTDQGKAWYASTFDDASWKSGKAELGYGDAPVTKISYGSDSNNKYVTSYFRKTFTLSEQMKSSASFTLNLQRDDGAVVYLNGKEVIRSNMPEGDITYKTLAFTTTDGAEETTFSSYRINASDLVAGTNVIAVEVHQINTRSSDVSFDLELLAQAPNSTLFSTDRNLNITLTGNEELAAIYESRGQNLVPDTLSQNTTFYKSLSPYVFKGDVVVPASVKLTIEPGVEIQMAPNSNLMVYGSLQAEGTSTDEILFKLNPDYSNAEHSWGALCFINATDTIRMSHVTIQDASKGPSPVRDVAAVSAFKSNLLLDHMKVISNENDPIVIRGGSVALTNSTLHSQCIGNLINVKNAKSRIENCVLEGNNFPDTDAIDYDDVDNGLIKNLVIRNFGGFNSDAIDLGESTDVIIDSVLIYNIFDKGISVGARTTLYVRDATIMNTNLGFGIKDSSTVCADACTFYSVGTPVACYEKVAGRAGGNAYVTNSILSNSSTATYLSDNHSYTTFNYCLSDNDSLPDKCNNRFGDPGFKAAGFFDFGLSEQSPARQAGFSKGLPTDLGSVIRKYEESPYILISDIYYNLNKDLGRTEYVGLYNPAETAVNLSGYIFSEAFDFVFPEGSIVQPKEKAYIVKSLDPIPEWAGNTNVWVWTSGSLANEGETVRLSNKYGIVMDQVAYKTDAPWPDVSGLDERVLTVLSPELDNHFGENWTTTDYALVVGVEAVQGNHFLVYPNPTKGEVTIKTGSQATETLELFSLTGQRLYTAPIQGETRLDLSRFGSRIILAKMGKNVEKIVVIGR